MNIYEQLQGIKDDLRERDASFKAIKVIDDMLAVAAGEINSNMSFSRLQVLRRVMQMPAVLNDEDIRLDFIGLEGDLEEAAAQRSAPTPAAYDDIDRRPKLKKHYKKK